jgi:hypothetical protein
MNRAHVEPWLLKKVVPKNPRVIKWQMIEHLCDMDDSQFGGDSEFITNDLRIGSNFAVHAEEDNDKGMEYYILIVLHPRFQVQ